MSDNTCKNRCIKCNVSSCKNHCNSDNFCSLDCICIGTHETDPKMNQCTDCQSFVNVNPSEQRKAIDKSRNESTLFEHTTNY
ncbi:MAG: DUF1540 domain-containing protein [Oscillospiraceae bacterium]